MNDDVDVICDMRATLQVIRDGKQRRLARLETERAPPHERARLAEALQAIDAALFYGDDGIRRLFASCAGALRDIIRHIRHMERLTAPEKLKT